MIDINKAVIARLKVKGNNFEVLVDCDKALLFKEGRASLDDCLAAEEIYKDAKRALRASENDIKKLFNTNDKLKVISEIIKKGEVQLTTEHMNKLREEKRKQIISVIHKNGIDGRTGLPHPPQRIEAAMQEAKIHVDAFKSAEEQVEFVLDKIRHIIPIKFEKKKLQIIIGHQYAGKAFNVLKRFGGILREDWLDDGSLSCVVEIPAGIQGEFYDEVNSLTHGSAIVKVQ